MLDVLQKAFPKIINSSETNQVLDEMIPYYNRKIDEALFNKQLEKSELILQLNEQ